MLSGGSARSAPGAAPAAKGAAAAVAPAAGKVPGYDVTWKEMSAEQKSSHMKETVLPKMKETFQKFDPVEFKKFNCQSCHGKAAKERKFKMPNPDILKLPDSAAGFGALLQKKPELQKWAKFMGEEVKPQVAALLGLPAFDPAKPAAGGFGCGACHAIQKSK